MLPHEDTNSFEVLDDQLHTNHWPTSPATALPHIPKKDDFFPQQESKQQAQQVGFYPIINDFQEEFMAPIRKRSTVSEDLFADETEVFPIQEIKQAEQSIQQSKNHIPEANQELSRVNSDIFSDSKGIESTQQFADEFQELCDISAKDYREETIRNAVHIVSVICQNGNFYWLAGSLIEVNLQSIKMLYDSLFDKECFIPLFNQDIFSQWNCLPKQQRQQLNRTSYLVLQNYIQQYTQFLSKYYHKQLVSALIAIKYHQQTIVTTQSKIKTDPYFKKINMSSILSGLNPFNSLSRTKIARKTIFKKLQSLSITKKQCHELRLPREVKKISEIEAYNWKILGQLDMLLSLEQTADYCDQRNEVSSEDKQRKFWINYRTSIRLHTQEYAQKFLCELLI